MNLKMNEKRKESCIAYSYKVSELFVAGVGIAGIMDNEKTSAWVMALGVIAAFAFFALGFWLQGDSDSAANLPDSEKPDDSS